MLWWICVVSTVWAASREVELYYEFGPNVVARSELLFCQGAMTALGNLSLYDAINECDNEVRDVREFVEFGRWMSARMHTTLADGVYIGSVDTRKKLDLALINNGFYVTNDTGIVSISDWDKDLLLLIGLISLVAGLSICLWSRKLRQIKPELA